MKRLAVIDIGTNSIHMVLAEIGKGFSYKIVDRIKEMARLGDGTFTSHRLSQEAMDRGLTVLKRFSMLANNKGFDPILPIATSAVREAKNGGDFLKLVRKELGLRVRVITPPPPAAPPRRNAPRMPPRYRSFAHVGSCAPAT
jgi:exopolyphosphatase/guanosine-5'-triphosphate,3'-diphosphate pyrophosphatase